MDILLFYAVIFLIGFLGSLISGMVGIGGSIIKYPLLLYVPPLLGLSAFTTHEVSGISAVQVFFAALAGAWAYRRGGFINGQLFIYMGTSVLVGSIIGSFGSGLLSPETINLTYALLATVAAILMLLPKAGSEGQSDHLSFNKGLAVILSSVVGFAAGIVGAAGAFILVPIMLVVLKIPTRVTVATSLAITVLSSLGTTIGKVATGQVLFWPALVMIVASVLGSPLGAFLSKRMNVKALQWILAVLIMATAVKIWLDLLN